MHKCIGGFKPHGAMDNWFTIDKINLDTYIISEYRHWEKRIVSCYAYSLHWDHIDGYKHFWPFMLTLMNWKSLLPLS